MLMKRDIENLGRYIWLFSDTEFDKGTFDIHFVLDTCTGRVIKSIEKRTDKEKNLIIKGDKK